MIQMLYALRTWLSHLPPTFLFLSGVLAVAVLLVLLWRSGWGLKHLRRLRVGPLEGERFDANRQDDKTLPHLSSRDVSTGEINVDVAGNYFGNKVGDIGGVINKGGSAGKKDDHS
jgi:hypothetical protein